MQHAHPIHSRTYLLLDRARRVVGVLCAQPKQDWQKVHKKAYKAIQRVASYFNSRAAKPHRRGTFHSIAHGLSFGGGQEVSEPFFWPIYPTDITGAWAPTTP